MATGLPTRRLTLTTVGPNAPRPSIPVSGGFMLPASATSVPPTANIQAPPVATVDNVTLGEPISLQATPVVHATPATPATPGAPAAHAAAAWPTYGDLFGHAPFVKDPANPHLIDMMSAATEAAPQLRQPPIGPALAAGRIDATAVKALQTMLAARGFDLGPSGTDGLFGPKTYAALVHFLEGAEPSPAHSNAPAGMPHAHDYPSVPNAPVQPSVPHPPDHPSVLHAHDRPSVPHAHDRPNVIPPNPPTPPAPLPGPAPIPGPLPHPGTGAAQITSTSFDAKYRLGNPAPSGYHAMHGAASQAVALMAHNLLGKPFGTQTYFEVDGKRYVARNEPHYHPPGFVGGPNGWHSGVTVYDANA
jgi:hypothetical protein